MVLIGVQATKSVDASINISKSAIGSHLDHAAALIEYKQNDAQRLQSLRRRSWGE